MKIIAAALVTLFGFATSARAQSAALLDFDQAKTGEAAAGLIGNARSLPAARPASSAPRASAAPDARLACFQSLDGYSYGLGALLSLSENTIVLPSKLAEPRGFYLLNANGAWPVAFPVPPGPGITHYQFALPVRFADSEHKATYLYYGHSGDHGIDLHPFLVAWRDPQAGEVYTKVAMEDGKSSPEAWAALREALLERVRTAHERFLDDRPRRAPAEYLERLNGCAAVSDPELQKAVGLEKAKF
jgi:hypothetical protein